MPGLTARFQEGMNLGQGFNSYTGQLCMQDAVTFGKPGEPSKKDNPPQDFEYILRFTNKLSDITSSMDISGSLDIKYKVLTGGAKGSYIDMNKFQRSDENLQIDITATNLGSVLPQDPQFNAPKGLNSKQFLDDYGDCYISGFVDGGEFHATVYITCDEDSDKKEILANAHIAIETGVFGAKGEGDAKIKDEALKKGMSTEVSVTSMGAGELKDADKDWNISTVKLAAARFQHGVATHSTHIRAILTKYQTLPAFKKQLPDVHLADLDNLNQQTDDFLVDAADYDLILASLREIQQDPTKYKESEAKSIFFPDQKTEIKIYHLDAQELDNARALADKQQKLIFKLGKELADDPKKEIKDNAYLRPLVFKSLLPVKIQTTKPPAEPVPATPDEPKPPA